MTLINRTQNEQCTMLRMAGSFRMIQEDWTKKSKNEEQYKDKSLNFKTNRNE